MKKNIISLAIAASTSLCAFSAAAALPSTDAERAVAEIATRFGQDCVRVGGAVTMYDTLQVSNVVTAFANCDLPQEGVVRASFHSAGSGKLVARAQLSSTQVDKLEKFFLQLPWNVKATQDHDVVTLESWRAYDLRP